MNSITRLSVFLILSHLGIAGIAQAQSPIPGGNDEAPGCGPTLEITEQPIANQNQQVMIEFKWTDNTGIKKIDVQMLKKDAQGNYTIEVSQKTINTNDPTATSITQMFPDPEQPANTKVKIKITTKAMDGTVIKTVTSNEATLP